MPRRQIGGFAGIAALALVLAAALIGVLRGTPSSLATAEATPAPPDQGAAHSIFAGNAGFAIAVKQVERSAAITSAPATGTGLQFVAVRVAFRNSSELQQRADPADSHLVDASGVSRQPTFLSGSSSCTRWQMTDLYPNGPGSAAPRDPKAEQAGRTFGPVPLCFAAAGDPNRPLTLVWDPDVGLPLFDTPTRVALR